MICAVPITQAAANEYVALHHRHHKPARGDIYRIAAVIDGEIVGVVQVGRPVARGLDDGKTCEVIRLCTDGSANVCSYLYSRAARIAREMGFHKIVTYILDTESGASLRAAGWRKEANTRGGSWNCSSRPRENTSPICPKQRWARDLIGGAQ